MRYSILVVSLSCAVGCMPPPPTEAPPPAAEPPSEGAIPWAPGEEPTSAEATTREVPPEPSEPAPLPVDDPTDVDGVTQASGGPVCTGKTPPSLRATVQGRASKTSACADLIPEARAGAKGRLEFSLRVEASGEVSNFELRSDTLGVVEVRACVEEIFRKPFTETPPLGGCAVFVVPVEMESELAPAEAPQSP